MSAFDELKLSMLKSLEEHFPKGISKERGKAMVLIAETIIAARKVFGVSR